MRMSEAQLERTFRLARFWFDETETASDSCDWDLAVVASRFLQVQLTGIHDHLQAMSGEAEL